MPNATYRGGWPWILDPKGGGVFGSEVWRVLWACHANIFKISFSKWIYFAQGIYKLVVQTCAPLIPHFTTCPTRSESDSDCPIIIKIIMNQHGFEYLPREVESVEMQWLE